MITEAEARQLMPPEHVKALWEGAKARGADDKAAVEGISQATYIRPRLVRAWLAFLGVDVGGDVMLITE